MNPKAIRVDIVPPIGILEVTRFSLVNSRFSVVTSAYVK